MLRIILTGEVQEETVTAEWRRAGARLEFVAMAQVIPTIRDEEEMQADCLVCIVDDEGEPDFPHLGTRLPAAIALSGSVSRLPDALAMPDGRKWNALPFVVLVRNEQHPIIGTTAGNSNLYVAPYQGSATALELVKIAVAEYRQRLLAELDNLGLVVRYEVGQYRVGHALLERPGLEGRYYYGPRDRRGDAPGVLFTVDRDLLGVQAEVEEFEQLINDPETTEPQLQRFFEGRPHFLPMQRLMHAYPRVGLRDADGRLLIPDFVLKPVVAAQRDRNWEVLELKRPQARLLTGPANHRSFSTEVTKALTQVRDYGDYFANLAHAEEVERALGRRLRHPSLAVLIGRLPSGEELSALDQEQVRSPHVRIVTYDEVLEAQRAELNR